MLLPLNFGITNCFRKVERQCGPVRLHCTKVADNVGQCMADIDIINAVKCSLSSGSVSYMNGINEEYDTDRHNMTQFVIDQDRTNFKVYLKHLITENIQYVDFVRPSRLKESEQVIISKTQAITVDNVIPLEPEEVLNYIVEVAKVLCRELLEHRDTWHITGSNVL